MKKIITLLFAAVFAVVTLSAQHIISVSPDGVNDVQKIKDAIELARTYNDEAVVIKLGGGTYHLHKNQATVVKYYISNTLSWNGSPDNLKHIGVYFKNLKNITLDGENARLVTHGEMTSVVIDESENITLKNLQIDAADPSVTEMTVESIDGNDIIYKVHPTSNYQISGKTLRWVGEHGWSFTGGPVQLYDPVEDITWRSGTPTDNLSSISDLGDHRIKITYSSRPGVNVGYTYQMRHGTRNQVAGFIHKSKDVVYDHVKMYFMGNFGIVGQFSENITYTNCHFAPEAGSGRTNAGFADFLQLSGCKGLIKVEDTYFSGAHDDPINIHGTYLKVQNYISSTKVKVQFMHHESWGFDAFFVGDSIEFVNVATMQSMEGAVVTEVQRNSDREITLTFDKAIDVSAYQAKPNGVVVENITWTPDVEIRRNYFSRVPTRGVLLTTRGRSVIEDNTFYKMQMAGIYVSGDAANWYESGKVTDLTIRNNKFIECGSPVIYFDPTNSQNDGYVHSNVEIDNNTFQIKSGAALGGKSVGNVSFTNNTIIHGGSGTADSYASLNNSSAITKSGNIKLQPGAISLVGKVTSASTSQTNNSHELGVDGKTNTSWRATTEDTEKWWKVDLGQNYSLNRIHLSFFKNYAWKYRIEVSDDDQSWLEVINQSDNSTNASSHSNAGNMGRDIRYVRITFNSADAGLTEVSVFGDEDLPFKEGLLSGTVIGTTGSWNNDAAATRDAVFDSNIYSYFDAPSGFGWAGLDFGTGAQYQIDSIRYCPREGDYHLGRMKNGRFELADNAAFSSPTLLYTVTGIPPFQYIVLPVDNDSYGRYARYASPQDGFGNIAEVEFYGKRVYTGVSQTEKSDVMVLVNNRSAKELEIRFNNQPGTHHIQLFNLAGMLVKSILSDKPVEIINYSNLLSGCFVLQVDNLRKKVIL